MIKAIIFDLDGTLLNTISDLNNSINKTYKLLNIDKENTEDMTMSMVGHGIFNLIEQCFSDSQVKEAYKLFLEFFLTHITVSIYLFIYIKSFSTFF